MRTWDIPPIPSRQFAEQFFTFLTKQQQWEWRLNPRLRHNLAATQREDERIEQQCQVQDSAFLVQHFLDICQDEVQIGTPQTLARWHLAAYLEAPCYQAARDRLRAFRNLQDSQQTWEEYLYIGQCLTNNPREVDRIYRRYRGQTNSLEDYFKLSLASLIQDIFHRQNGRGKYSVWYSLKEASTVKLTEKLEDLGESSPRIARCLEARKCLFEVYSKSGRRWLEPTGKQYQEAARFCSSHCFSINSEDFKQLIKACVRALQATPKVSYLGEDIETYKAQSARDVVAESQPWQQKREDLNARLQSELETLEQEENNRALLMLRFGLALSGASIGNCLGVNQATISRHLARRQRQLLKVALTWLGSHIELDEQGIAQTSEYINLWLQQHYKKPLTSVLKDSWHNHLDESQKQLLLLRYFEDITERHIAQQQKRSPAEIRSAIAAVREMLLLDVLNWVETTLNLSVTGERERKRIAKVVEEWLANEQKTQ